MVQSRATTVAAYLAALPPERREVIAAVRKVIRAHLPRGYREMMGWGVITYAIPLRRFPDTYNGQPLCYVALAAQKHYNALYLMCVYGDRSLSASLRAAFERAGLKLDMGKSCVRFRALEDLPLPAIGELIAKVPVEEYLRRYERVKGTRG